MEFGVNQEEFGYHKKNYNMAKFLNIIFVNNSLLLYVCSFTD